MSKRIMLLTMLAFRNLRRQLRRSLLTAAAMVLGLALLVFSRALAEGAHQDWIKGAVRLGSGHITVQAPGFHRTGKIEDHLSSQDVAAVRDVLATAPLADLIETAAPHLSVRGLANSPANAIPVMIMGVDPAVEPSFSKLNEKLVAGRYLVPGDRLHAYIGVTLAARLRLDVGSRMVLTAQDATGEMAGQFVRVAGIFRVGVPDVDRSIVQIPLSIAQQWLATEGGITSYDILLASSDSQQEVLDSLSRMGNSGVTLLPWQEAMPELNSAITMDDYGDFIFHGILFGIITLAIINTVLMSVLQRTREFGVLRALGLRRRETGAMVFFEGMLITAVSGVFGMILGIGVTWGFFRDGLDFSRFMDGDFTAAGTVIDPVMIPKFTVEAMILSLVAIAVIGMVSSIYPAYRATRIDIAESMKFET